LGFSVLKGGGFLNDEVRRLQCEAFGHVTGNWEINLDFHCGGYAKRSDRLDPRWEQVYVARMMLGISTLAGEGRLDGLKVVALVTG
jgi:1-aminocyclopropane-1-carboxylate deaminase